uniref:hypothetical protein n=1 Tax=Flavobacterium sp. TaxID=239 RepID=UPI00404B2BAE
MNLWRFTFLLLLTSSCIFGQDIETPYKRKKIKPSQDIIMLDSVSINQAFFKILDANQAEIDTSFYKIDFQKAQLSFKSNYFEKDSVTVRYLKFPDFMTKTYQIYDPKRVVSNEAGKSLFQIKSIEKSTSKMFQGLSTNGSITRGVTIGNNQNAVVNSNLDLQIMGNISEKVSIRASIQDSNIPLQEGGYSQRLDEFDQIFIELFSENWNIRAGDLFLENRTARFLNFNKKVQGLYTRFNWENTASKTTVEAAGALVRGQYARSVFTGQEGNQGPYKLRGNNNELYVLVISGSERVFVNGILLQRGENNQYIIDYNAGEIRFTSLFPITSEMRIQVEYQYSDQNYTRFVTYGGVNHEREQWHIGTYLYSENDVKNQPLQQSLSEEQVGILANAGDNTDLMNAPSAYEDTFSENKILYELTTVNGVEVYVFSNNPDATLYNVRFSLVGDNLGNYVLANNQTVGRIYEYVAPLNGIPQGNYEPIIRLVPPTKIQIATVVGGFNPNEKTKIDFELATSFNDINLYSSLDDDNNQGFAGSLDGKQRLYTTEKWLLDANLDWQWIQQDFRTIERLFTIEFNRDWNLTGVQTGNQQFVQTGLDWRFTNGSFTRYQFEKLDFSNTFSGNRHRIDGLWKIKNILIQNQGSLMSSDATTQRTHFFRNQSQAKYHFNKNWVGAQYNLESVEEVLIPSETFSNQSQRFQEWGALLGRGDSTKVYVELGFLQRKSDSLVDNTIKHVTTSNTYFLKSKLIQTEKSNLSVFLNYRVLNFTDAENSNIKSLNSRIAYNDVFFNQILQTATTYENTSGTIAQQEFTYLEVEAGQGVYTWIDYNNNGIQELEEFEIAPFPDLATYVRVFLPNQVFLPTHQNRFSQSLVLNYQGWQNEKGFKKFVSHFYNQTSFLVERKIARKGENFDLNPFSNATNDLLGLNLSWRNSLFYNRGKQKHSVTYTFLNNRARNLLSAGFQETKNNAHQTQYVHLYKKTWLFSMQSNLTTSVLESENYSEKNFEIIGQELAPKVSYLFSQNTSLELLFEWQKKQNNIRAMEQLTQTRFGIALTLNGIKNWSMNGSFSLYRNNFEGQNNTAVAFQMLEGLQPGNNQTWQILVQKSITDFLDININYQGRKSETSATIHTGSVQLRAYF